MPMHSPSDFEAPRRALSHFSASAARTIAQLGGGHIHDTFLVELDAGALVLQRFNTRVFESPTAVMDNIARVVTHARERLQQRGIDPARRVLSLRRTLEGAWFASTDADGIWRAFDRVEQTIGFGSARRPSDAYQAGRAFGQFASLLRDLPAPALNLTIEGFHAAELRLVALRSALARDPLRRAAAVQIERQAIEQHAPIALECLQLAGSGRLPERVAHNDAKLDNVLFDAASGEGLCVVDLDTVMPGHLAHDFGDLVRTAACSGSEDSADLHDVGFRPDYFEALARGYLAEVDDFLGPDERTSLVRGASWIVLELAMRFLTDHLLGDTYFKVDRPGHNLERARVQLHLLTQFEREQASMRRIIA
jgi:hypothetical protein